MEALLTFSHDGIEHTVKVSIRDGDPPPVVRIELDGEVVFERTVFEPYYDFVLTYGSGACEVYGAFAELVIVSRVARGELRPLGWAQVRARTGTEYLDEDVLDDIEVDPADLVHGQIGAGVEVNRKYGLSFDLLAADFAAYMRVIEKVSEAPPRVESLAGTGKLYMNARIYEDEEGAIYVVPWLRNDVEVDLDDELGARVTNEALARVIKRALGVKE